MLFLAYLHERHDTFVDFFVKKKVLQYNFSCHSNDSSYEASSLYYKHTILLQQMWQIYLNIFGFKFLRCASVHTTNVEYYMKLRNQRGAKKAEQSLEKSEPPHPVKHCTQVQTNKKKKSEPVGFSQLTLKWRTGYGSDCNRFHEPIKTFQHPKTSSTSRLQLNHVIVQAFRNI